METTQKSICDLCAHLPICKHTPQQSCSFWAQKELKKPLEPKAQVTPKRSFLHTLWRWCVRIAVVLCIILSFVAGVLVTWYGFAPRIVSLVPKISQPVEPGAPPDEIITQFFQAERMADREKLLTLMHPDVIRDASHIVTDLLNNSDRIRALREIKILDVTMPEETATAVVSITTDDGQAISGQIALKKHQGEWRILDFD
jgi:hypothetical protein